MRVGGAHDLRKQVERWIVELVFLQNRVERNVLAVVTQLAVGNVIENSVCDASTSPCQRAEKQTRLQGSMNFE